MHWHTYGPRVIALAIGVVLLLTAALTRDRWVPLVFPAKADAKGEGGHAHGGEKEAPAAGGGHEGHDHAHGGDRVKLSAQAQANLKLEVDALAPEEYWRKAQIPGVVVERPGQTDRGVTARVAGLVTEIKARPGDTVKAGEPLFTLQLVSEFIQSTQSELAKAARELQFAETRRTRTVDLVRLGTKSQADLVEDDNQVKRFTTQMQAYRRQLLTFGLSADQVNEAEKGGVVTEVTITAPARAPATKGADQKAPDTLAAKDDAPVYEVQELKVQLGEQVQAGQTLALLANHQLLYVEGRAFKSEAAGLARAAKETWKVDAEFAEEAKEKWSPIEPLAIRHLSNSVDPATRTFAFYLPLKNQSDTYEKDGRTFFVWRFRPGQRVRLKVPMEKLGDDVFVLPAGAVVREGAEAFVFSQNGDLFERKPVRVLYEDRIEVVLANDGSVTVGQFIVRNQAAALNRAVKSAAAAEGGHGGGDHHGHSHD